MIDANWLHEAAHESFIKSWCQDSEAVQEADGILCYTTSLGKYVGHRGVYRLDPNVKAVATVDRAVRYAKDSGGAVVLQCRPGIDNDVIAFAVSQGFTHAETFHVLGILDPDETPLPVGVGIQPVDDLATLDRFRKVMIAAWGGELNGQDLEAFFTPARILERRSATAFIVTSEGEDVAGAVTQMIGFTPPNYFFLGDIFWVGTVPHRRNQGFATVATREALNIAFDSGASAAVLQATEQVAPLYEGIGFKKLFVHELWITP